MGFAFFITSSWMMLNKNVNQSSPMISEIWQEPHEQRAVKRLQEGVDENVHEIVE
jgi:hypothetical protein